jgi:hypothetical protein
MFCLAPLLLHALSAQRRAALHLPHAHAPALTRLVPACFAPLRARAPAQRAAQRRRGGRHRAAGQAAGGGQRRRRRRRL